MNEKHRAFDPKQLDPC